MTRTKGEIPFPANVWLKRYRSIKTSRPMPREKWFQIRREDLIKELQRYIPDTYEHLVEQSERGSCMSFYTEYAEFYFLTDSAYQDELDWEGEPYVQ